MRASGMRDAVHSDRSERRGGLGEVLHEAMLGALLVRARQEEGPHSRVRLLRARRRLAVRLADQAERPSLLRRSHVLGELSVEARHRDLPRHGWVLHAVWAAEARTASRSQRRGSRDRRGKSEGRPQAKVAPRAAASSTRPRPAGQEHPRHRGGRFWRRSVQGSRRAVPARLVCRGIPLPLSRNPLRRRGIPLRRLLLSSHGHSRDGRRNVAPPGRRDPVVGGGHPVDPTGRHSVGSRAWAALAVASVRLHARGLRRAGARRTA